MDEGEGTSEFETLIAENEILEDDYFLETMFHEYGEDVHYAQSEPGIILHNQGHIVWLFRQNGED
jgi:hypothetical protein